MVGRWDMANRIRELRKAMPGPKGWSQVKLAKEVGTSDQQISNLEIGKRKLTQEWMRRIASALKCPDADLTKEPTPSGSTAVSGPLDHDWLHTVVEKCDAWFAERLTEPTSADRALIIGTVYDAGIDTQDFRLDVETKGLAHLSPFLHKIVKS